MKRFLIRAGIALGLLAPLAAMVIPDFLRAQNSGRQRRTMADMRTIATAWEARATDINSYTIGRPDKKSGARMRPVATSDLERALAPTYVRKFPRADGWGNAFQFSAGDFNESGQAQFYTIRSLGGDQRLDRNPAVARGATTDFASDVIYSNGSFTQYPEASG